MDNWHNIKVNSKILGHMSSGIYGSPASALKELVSNAFDADATRVAITTNWPSFDIITCRDNGSGMAREKFQKIMTEEIGNSAKRVPTCGSGNDVTNKGRPIIGWFGIGMLGIAQICHEFVVISHHRETKTAFSARIRLADFVCEKVGDISPHHTTHHRIDVGQFMIEPIDYEPKKAGTCVVASDIRSAFIKTFRETLGEYSLPSKFPVFLNKIHSARSVKVLGDYWQMVWELSVTCPLPYLDIGPFDYDRIEIKPNYKAALFALEQSLKAYQFEVVVDGLSLRRPNQYPRVSLRTSGHEGIRGRLFPVNEETTVYGRRLKFSGYIFAQDSRAIVPAELRGVLVRIRNVGIGTYDQTFFKFPITSTSRFNCISGEVYIDEGLESALHINRASFNEMHPHFIKLKEIIHNLLKKEIFRAID